MLHSQDLESKICFTHAFYKLQTKPGTVSP